MESKAELRRELEDAIANVRRQIDFQVRAGRDPFAGVGPSGDALVFKELQDELAQLEEALAGLKGDD